MAALPEHPITVEEYLRLDSDSEIRNEYYDGLMYAMSGASEHHILIVRNLVAELRSALRNTPCRPYMNDMRVRVSPERLYAYPDVVVACGERQFASDQRDTLLNPTLIIEVLSPSTEANDRGFKAAHYRNLESLREYALVSQAEPRIEIYRRYTEGWLLSDLVGAGSACRFESVGCEIPFSEIYHDVEFAPQAPTP